MRTQESQKLLNWGFQNFDAVRVQAQRHHGYEQLGKAIFYHSRELNERFTSVLT